MWWSLLGFGWITEHDGSVLWSIQGFWLCTSQYSFGETIFYGFYFRAVGWIRLYPSNIFQQTILFLNNSKIKSKWRKIQVDVPWWSILELYLFLIYVNDFPKSVYQNLVLYADNTTAIVKANFVEGIGIWYKTSYGGCNKLVWG